MHQGSPSMLSSTARDNCYCPQRLGEAGNSSDKWGWGGWGGWGLNSLVHHLSQFAFDFSTVLLGDPEREVTPGIKQPKSRGNCTSTFSR